MSTTCIEFSEKESSAIKEYAMMCKESVSKLIYKIVIQEITFMKNDVSEKPEIYEYNMMMPSGISDYDENKIIEANYNKIRKILSLKKINLYGAQYV